MSARRADSGGIVVIGLGRFGCHLAGSLTRMNREVLAIERSPTKVQRWSAVLDRVVQADATEEGRCGSWASPVSDGRWWPSGPRWRRVC